MARLDISAYADRLIRAAAPERTSELDVAWGSSENRMHLTDDARFDIGAWFGFIQLTETSLRQIWLLGYAAWRAIGAYSGIFNLLERCRLPFVRDEVARGHGQVEADAQISRIRFRHALTPQKENQCRQTRSSLTLCESFRFKFTGKRCSAFPMLHKVRRRSLDVKVTHPAASDKRCRGAGISSPGRSYPDAGACYYNIALFAVSAIANGSQSRH